MRSFVIIVAALLTVASQAQAQANRTFVSGHGSDSNPCSLTAPCRSFAQAITQTGAGGEIAVLDTAGYGAVTINKAVSIVNEAGVEAGITVTSGDGITITAGTNDVVNLRGLTLVGAGGLNGITLNSAANLNIQNCVIRGFGNVGLNLIPTVSADINVSSTIVSGNTNFGIILFPSGTALRVTASFEQVQAIHNNGNGFYIFGSLMTGTLRAIAADSLASGNKSAGVGAVSAAGKASAVFVVANSKVANNQTGLLAGVDGYILLNGSTLSGNITGFDSSSGTIFSYGNNAYTDTSFIGTTTPAPLQ